MTVETLCAERVRRETLAAKLERHLKAHAGEWISLRELGDIGGIGGWRSRLSDLARRKVDPMHIEWNRKNGSASCHRYLPYVALGPDPAEYREQSLFTDMSHPSGFQR